ncbi:hypothetical protein AAFC00_004021 [Neodothiora populina]|uniref:Chloride channel protein n=1 Tax=Neodothiora populina TaxID=2781224 RepID=A0ABR3PJC2_9PEZI
MPRSVASYYSYNRNGEDDNQIQNEDEQASASRGGSYPSSPRATRRPVTRQSDQDLRSRLPSRLLLDEHSSLLDSPDGRPSYRSVPASPRLLFKRQQSHTNSLRRNHSRHGSLGFRVAKALGAERNEADDTDPLAKSTASIYVDDRVWYDQFTSTDWVQDSIADAFRLKQLRSKKGFKARVQALFDAAEGWILVAIIGCLTAGVAYLIDTSEAAIFDWKEGYCSSGWYQSKKRCCEGGSVCDNWMRWSTRLTPGRKENEFLDFAVFVFWVMLLACLGCLVTLRTRTVISSAISLSTLDEDLGAERRNTLPAPDAGKDSLDSPTRRFVQATQRPPMVYFPAAGSGVAEVKVILSGFIIRGFLGLRTLVFKTIGLILAVASGLSIGKEGPLVHIASCIGNVACRMFEKYSSNDAKRREILSASAAAGVAVAFGSPIGGVLFSLEEVSYYFPPKTLFRTFFCCIAAALSLKFLNPYGTNKIVLFEVRYLTDWRSFEMVIFILLGVLGGLLGALFIKASRIWARTFRRIPMIKGHPLFEVCLVAFITGLVSYWNKYTRMPVAELLYELASPCSTFTPSGYGLCPTEDNIPQVIWYLAVAFIVKSLLTVVTFGVKIPAGIYVPSMVVGGLLGRIVGHVVQYITLAYPHWGIFRECAMDGNPESCVTPGVYDLVAAGATMCGVTRLSVTLAVILFELTGSLEHVLPFSIGVLVSKWTADALEPLSIYDLLTDMNSYPYLDAKSHPPFTEDLGDITPAVNPSRIIDVSSSPIVAASQLRSQLDHMHMAGELDGGLPIVKDGTLVGIIPGPDLEFALDRLGSEEDDALCQMTSTHSRPRGARMAFESAASDNDEDDEEEGASTGSNAPLDFSAYIDPSPLALDICSPMELVYECFSKLGLRYICVLKQGRFVGLVHKKGFVRYVKELEEKERNGS